MEGKSTAGRIVRAFSIGLGQVVFECLNVGLCSDGLPIPGKKKIKMLTLQIFSSY